MADSERPLLWKYRDTVAMQLARLVVAVGALVISVMAGVALARDPGVRVAMETAVFAGLAAVHLWGFWAVHLKRSKQTLR